jgi:hypothetical protein
MAKGPADAPTLGAQGATDQHSWNTDVLTLVGSSVSADSRRRLRTGVAAVLPRSASFGGHGCETALDERSDGHQSTRLRSGLPTLRFQGYEDPRKQRIPGLRLPLQRRTRESDVERLAPREIHVHHLTPALQPLRSKKIPQHNPGLHRIVVDAVPAGTLLNQLPTATANVYRPNRVGLERQNCGVGRMPGPGV